MPGARPRTSRRGTPAQDDWHTTQSTVDLREGGTFSARMEAKDGRSGFDFEGTYTRVVPRELIEYRMSDGREVKVEFAERRARAFTGVESGIMSRTFTDVWKDAAELSDEDRATLAGLLIESLEGDPDPDVEAAWAAEIEKRVAELNAGTVKSIPWEEVRYRLLNRPRR